METADQHTRTNCLGVLKMHDVAKILETHCQAEWDDRNVRQRPHAEARHAEHVRDLHADVTVGATDGLALLEHVQKQVVQVSNKGNTDGVQDHVWRCLRGDRDMISSMWSWISLAATRNRLPNT